MKVTGTGWQLKKGTYYLYHNGDSITITADADEILLIKRYDTRIGSVGLTKPGYPKTKYYGVYDSALTAAQVTGLDLTTSGFTVSPEQWLTGFLTLTLEESGDNNSDIAVTVVATATYNPPDSENSNGSLTSNTTPGAAATDYTGIVVGFVVIIGGVMLYYLWRNGKLAALEAKF